MGLCFRCRPQVAVSADQSAPPPACLPVAWTVQPPAEFVRTSGVLLTVNRDQLAVPEMTKVGGGSIVNISSVNPSPFQGRSCHAAVRYTRTGVRG